MANNYVNELIVPSTVNVLTLVNDNIVRNKRNGQSADIALPSLRQRASMLVNENNVLLVQQAPPPTGSAFR